jgi:hypothetical protein
VGGGGRVWRHCAMRRPGLLAWMRWPPCTDSLPAQHARTPRTTPGPIVVSLGTRYTSYCANIGRTFFVNCGERFQAQYGALLAAHAAAVDALREGAPTRHAMEAALKVRRVGVCAGTQLRACVRGSGAAAPCSGDCSRLQRGAHTGHAHTSAPHLPRPPPHTHAHAVPARQRAPRAAGAPEQQEHRLWRWPGVQGL